MKTFYYSSLILLISIFAGNRAIAQSSEKHDYVVLTKKTPQLKPILLTAEKLKAQDGDSFGDFQVIFCGKDIGDLTDPLKINAYLKKADKIGVQLVACGFSLKKFNVSKEKIPRQIKIVENGILYNFELQKVGFMSLSL